MALVKLPEHGECFLCNDEEKNRVAVKFYWDEEKKKVFADAKLGLRAQGPPGHAHGGSIFSILDEAMGGAAWMCGYPVVAAKISIDFIIMVPLEENLAVEGWVDSCEGRKVWTKGELKLSDGRIAAKAEGLFIILKIEKFSAKKPYPYS